MNANELADFIDGNVSPFIDDHQEYLDKATAMLRQQQAEIEALKEKLIMEEESYMLLDEECLFAKEAIKQQQTEIEALKAERTTIFGFIKSRGEVGQLIVYKASLEAQEK